MRVSLAKSDRSFSVAPDESVLDAALRAGLNLPYSCKGGNCGACRARLVSGAVHYPNGKPLGLSDAEVGEGFVLLCQARARADLCIETIEVATPDSIVIKRLPSRVERVAQWSHDVLAVFLKLPAAEAFDFEPGQYIDIMLSKGRRRSFSIASPPHDSSLLELHVRRVPGGEFTETLFTNQARRTLLSIEGPLGRFTYRPGTAPMLLVGGGTGLAPLLCILRHVIETGVERDMTLYWGVRGEEDLYAHDTLSVMAHRCPYFHYVPVLSEMAAGWPGRRGLVHIAVVEDMPTLAGQEIYVSGPPALVAAARRDFVLHGADADRLYFDSFDYAPDALARQRSSAATKS